ncbi:A28R protein [Salmon gill poxvirus]|uniref:A28R protein n=1 Tax=Salmon gill poxvirus TaxID=1680908 RepID=A0A0H4XWP5_9POXV|nr:A28R protein [Salmon gill poxvirus]AKR04251.1 A28R protein [Salmon gill poxvirus]
MRFSDIFLIISVICVCFFLQQAWLMWSDWPKILEFVHAQKQNEYVQDSKHEYSDFAIYDPNDVSLEKKEKWRCVVSNSLWYQINNHGAVSNPSGTLKVFSTMSECKRNLFLYKGVRIYIDPCLSHGDLCSQVIYLN